MRATHLVELADATAGLRLLLATALVCLGAGLLCQSSPGEEAPGIEWERTQPGAGRAYGVSVVEAEDGGFAMSGSTGPGGFGPGWGFLAKTDAAGELLWWKTYSGWEGLRAEETDDGGFVVAGIRSLSEAVLGRTDASANLLWEKTIPAPWSEVASVAELAAGGFLLSGKPFRSVQLVRTDAEGAVLWEKTVETEGTAADAGIARPTSDGGYIVTADSQGELYLGKLGYRGHSFLRGDANGDGAVDLSDVVRTLNALFLDGGPVSCGDAADSNDDGGLDGSDAVYTLRYLFQGGEGIPFPGPKSCRNDPTPDELRCESFPRCF